LKCNTNRGFIGKILKHARKIETIKKKTGTYFALEGEYNS
jgi:hypothetical protein